MQKGLQGDPDEREKYGALRKCICKLCAKSRERVIIDRSIMFNMSGGDKEEVKGIGILCWSGGMELGKLTHCSITWKKRKKKKKQKN